MKLYHITQQPGFRLHAAVRSMRRHRATMRALRGVAVTAIGVAMGLAVVSWLTPCEAGALCTVLPAATRTNPFARAWSALRCAYLRSLVRSAEFDVQVLQEEIAVLPLQLQTAQSDLAALRVRLADAEQACRHG